MLLTIALLTKNSEDTVRFALRSIYRQKIPDDVAFELIVVDGYSKDNTLKIVKEFVERRPKLFYGVKVVAHNRNYGVSKARNDGIKMSRRGYILVLDHDVIMPRDTIAKLPQYLESADKRVVAATPLHNPTCKGVIGSWEYIIRKGRI
jgi:glycosyltransferase involved in cell wall biosynthesis